MLYSNTIVFISEREVQYERLYLGMQQLVEYDMCLVKPGKCLQSLVDYDNVCL